MAAPQDGIFIEWTGLAELESYFGELEENAIEELIKGMEEYSLLVETGARALTHRYSGDLEQSIVAAAVAFENNMIIGEVGTNLVYAWWIHEKPYGTKINDLYDNGYYEKDFYVHGRGRFTREKAYWRGEMPGRKYLERAVAVTEGDFNEIMGRALDRALGGGR